MHMSEIILTVRWRNKTTNQHRNVFSIPFSITFLKGTSNQIRILFQKSKIFYYTLTVSTDISLSIGPNAYNQIMPCDKSMLM